MPSGTFCPEIQKIDVNVIRNTLFAHLLCNKPSTMQSKLLKYIFLWPKMMSVAVRELTSQSHTHMIAVAIHNVIALTSHTRVHKFIYDWERGTQNCAKQTNGRRMGPKNISRRKHDWKIHKQTHNKIFFYNSSARFEVSLLYIHTHIPHARAGTHKHAVFCFD